jgi:hypothetical protein
MVDITAYIVGSILIVCSTIIAIYELDKRLNIIEMIKEYRNE